MEIVNVCPDASKTPADVADYILDCHDGDVKEAINAMIEEIEHCNISSIWPWPRWGVGIQEDGYHLGPMIDYRVTQKPKVAK